MISTNCFVAYALNDCLIIIACPTNEKYRIDLQGSTPVVVNLPLMVGDVEGIVIEYSLELDDILITFVTVTKMNIN